MTETHSIKGIERFELLDIEQCKIATYLPQRFCKVPSEDLIALIKTTRRPTGEVFARPVTDHYEIFIGITEFLAYKANWENGQITCRILHNEQAVVQALYKVTQDHTVIEQAELFYALMRHFGWSQSELSRKLAIGQPTIANRLKLLSLDPQVIEMVKNFVILPVSAKYLSTVKSHKQQLALANQSIKNQWTTQALYQAINPTFKPANQATTSIIAETSTSKADVTEELHLQIFKDRLSERLTTPLTIQGNKHTKYKGSIEIPIIDAITLVTLGDRLYELSSKAKLFKGRVVLEITDLEHLNAIYDDLIPRDQD